MAKQHGPCFVIRFRGRQSRMTPEEVIKNHLEPLQDVLTTWIEGPYVAKMLSEPETRERYMGFVEGIRLSRANVIQAIYNLTPQEEEE